MSTSLVPTNVVHPYTGETLELTHAQMDDLGSFLTELRDYASRSREAVNLVTQEILRRQDAQAKWTTRTHDYTIKGASPAPVEEFDELALRSDLGELVDRGVITEDAAGAAVETIVTYKARKAGITALRKLGGEVAEVINRHSTEVEKPRRVSVSRNA